MATLTALGIKSPAGGDLTTFLKDVIIKGDATFEEGFNAKLDMICSGGLIADKVDEVKWRGTVNLRVRIADVSTAEYVSFVVPVSGYVTRIRTVLGGVITVADATIHLCSYPSGGGGEIHVASTTVTVANAASGAGITHDSGAFDYTDAKDAAVGSVAAGDRRDIHTDGGSTDAQTLDVFIEISQFPW